jgi:hypothetical protein
VDDRDDDDARLFDRLDLTGIRSQSVMAIKSTGGEKWLVQRCSMYASAYQPIRIEGNRRQVALCEDVDAAKALLLQGRGNDGGV